MKIPLTFAALIFASAEDLKRFHIPDACFILIMVLSGKFRLRDGVVVAALWFGMVVIVSFLNLPVPIGAGDAKLLTALAVSFGLDFTGYTFAFAAVASGLFSLILLLRSKLRNSALPAAIPFAPFITAGFALTVLFRAF